MTVQQGDSHDIRSSHNLAGYRRGGGLACGPNCQGLRFWARRQHRGWHYWRHHCWLLPQIGLALGGSIIAAIINAVIGAVILLLVIGLFKRGG